MSEQGAGSNWNVPNALTALRIAMVPVFGWALLHDGGDSQGEGKGDCTHHEISERGARHQADPSASSQTAAALVRGVPSASRNPGWLRR